MSLLHRSVSAAAAAALVVAAGAVAGPIVINEIDADQAGTDAMEFIELYDGGAGNTALDGLVVVLFNGSGDVSYDAIDLDGFSTDENGFFVIGSDTVPNVDLVAWTTNGLQNGADAVALYMANAEDFPNDTPPTAENLVDALVYDTNDADDAELIAVFGGPQINEGENGDPTIASIGRLPDGTGDFFTIDGPTPGASNGGAPPPVILSVTKSGPAFAAPGSQITYTLTIENDGEEAATDVTIVDTLPPDATFIEETSPEDVTLDDATEPTIGWSTLTVDAGEVVVIELVVELPETPGDVVNTVDITTTSEEDDPEDNTDSVTTSIVAPADLVINEILADPLSGDPAGDANGDGVTNTSEDEFVELVNDSDSDLDMSNWTVSDSVGVRHTFPEGTIVPAGCAVVVFGGGTPTGEFGGAVVQTASEGFTGFNNGGDSVIVKDDMGADVTAYTYGGEGGNDQSLVRDPDIIGPEPLVLHSEASMSGGALFSPGTRQDGTPFAGCVGEACAEDVVPDGEVDVQDLVEVVLNWGDCPGCPADVNGDDVVDVQDMVAVILAWGPCP